MTTPTPAAGRRARSRLLVQRLLVLLLFMLVAGVGLAGPAAAHNALISSDPADGSTLQQAPTSVRLTFDQPVQDFEPVVTIIGPDGQRYESGSPQIDSTVVRTGISALPVAGSYSVAYRIVSADGHPVEGSIAFQLADGAVAPGPAAPPSSGAQSSAALLSSSAAPPSSGAQSSASGSASGSAAGSAAATATSTSSVTAAPVASSSGLSGWVWAAIAVAAVLVIAAIVVILRRPQQPE